MAKAKGGKKGGKKGKKGPALVVDENALRPFDVSMNDLIATPLGVECTVAGVKDGMLMLKWPGGTISTPLPHTACITWFLS